MPPGTHFIHGAGDYHQTQRLKWTARGGFAFCSNEVLIIIFFFTEKKEPDNSFQNKPLSIIP